MNERKLGIVAGGGDIPRMLIEYCLQQKREFFVLAIEGNANEDLVDDSIPHAWIRLGQAGSGFKRLKDEQVQDVVMIGTIKLVRGVHEVMPELLVKSGILTKHKPDKKAIADIKRGVEVGLELGRLDVGQSVIVQQGLVLGVEGIEGTDKLIIRCGDYKRKGEGGVLVKLRKPEQDMRIDLPTIGIKTLQNAKNSGLRGVAVHAGNALIVDEKNVIDYANKEGLFIIGINPADYINESEE